MSLTEDLARRVRTSIALFPETFTEKKMFGGISFLYQGKMTVGVLKNDLAVRLVSTKMDELLQLPYVRPMDFTKRPMKEFIYVSSEGFKTEEQLLQWITLGLEHAKSKL
ncbi:TfoX/Sxy family protein [Spongiimicrobium salis]|uniref:TfoX/Sxy family protein n=1 Tax=Spongiimicrobium salis TaxID=1667022 RepID=UPI00374CF077